jgi:hypothetical protein
MENVYTKIQDMRVELQNAGLQKSGHNKFADYKYFELEDFIPTVNKMMQEKGLCSRFEYAANGGGCELSIFESAKPEVVIAFQIPMSTASLKGCHEVQNLGAVVSYIRRYLWTLALEIVESDALDRLPGKDPSMKRQEDKPKQEAQPIDVVKLAGFLAGIDSSAALEAEWNDKTFQARRAVSGDDIKKIDKLFTDRNAILKQREGE